MPYGLHSYRLGAAAGHWVYKRGVPPCAATKFSLQARLPARPLACTRARPHAHMHTRARSLAHSHIRTNTRILFVEVEWRAVSKRFRRSKLSLQRHACCTRAPHRTALHRTALHRTALHRAAPHRSQVCQDGAVRQALVVDSLSGRVDSCAQACVLTCVQTCVQTCAQTCV